MIPSLVNSSVNGSSIIIPYFNVISENKDMTISPRLYANKNFLIQNEYRQVEENSNHITDFSLKKLDHSTKSHFFSNTIIDLNSNLDQSSLELNLEKTSNDTYLKSDNIRSKTRNSENQSLLNSFITYKANSDDLSFFAEFGVYEDLSKKNSDKYQYIFPNFTISKLLNTPETINGRVNYQISGLSQKRDTNVSESYIINDLNYSSNSIFSKFGTISNYDIQFKNTTKKGKNSSNYNKKTQSDNYTSLILSSSLPLEKDMNIYSSNFIPKAMFRYSPTKSENLSNLDRKINITNIFSKNRLGINESLEGGQSFTFRI